MTAVEQQLMGCCMKTNKPPPPPPKKDNHKGSSGRIMKTLVRGVQEHGH